MLEFFQEGGFSMFFLLGFGVFTLVLAVRYARVPTRVRFRTTLGLAAATGFATLTSVLANVAAVGHHASEFLERHREMTLPEVLLQGVAESMAPGILGFTLLALAAVVVTVGIYREPLA